MGRWSWLGVGVCVVGLAGCGGGSHGGSGGSGASSSGGAGSAGAAQAGVGQAGEGAGSGVSRAPGGGAGSASGPAAGAAGPGATSSGSGGAGSGPPSGGAPASARGEGSAGGGRASTGPTTSTSRGTPSQRRSERLDVVEVTHITGRDGAVILEAGTVRGTPLGGGTVTMRARLTGGEAQVSFTVVGLRGAVSGVARVRLTFGRQEIDYSGTATLTRGTGGYRGVSAPTLRVSGRGDLAGRHTVLHITGVAYL